MAATESGRAGWSAVDDDGDEHDSTELWLVTVTNHRTSRFWVKAPDRKSAEEAGEALSSDKDLEPEEFDDDMDVVQGNRIRQRPQEDDVCWVGGEQGHWVLLKEVVNG